MALNCLVFDGAATPDQFIEVPIPALGADGTIEIGFRAPALPAGTGFAMAFMGTDATGLALNYSPGLGVNYEGRLFGYDFGTPHLLSPAGAIDAGDVCWAVLRRNTGTANIMLGVGGGTTPVQVDSDTSAAPFDPTKLVLGKTAGSPVGIGGGGLDWTGQIFELRVWSDYRTDQEIADNAWRRLNGDESGLVAYVQMDEGSGTTTEDLVADTDLPIGEAEWDTLDPNPFAGWTPTAGLPRWDLTIFDMDGVPLFGLMDSGELVQPCFSTDPAHPRPWLDWPRDGVGSSVDFFAGKAKVGQFNVLVLDKRSDAADQDTGQITAILGDYQGLNGLRCRLVYTDAAGTSVVAIDGPISTPRLHSSYAGWEWAIRDENIRTRKVRAFDRTGMISVFPRGPLTDFGLLPNGQYAIPAADVFTGTYEADDANQGKVWAASGALQSERVLTGAMAEACKFTWDESVQANVLEHCVVRWRAAGTGTWPAGQVLTRMPAYRAESTVRDRFGRRVHTHYVENELFETRTDSFKLHDPGGDEREYRDVSIIRAIRLRTGGGTLPTDGQDVELQVVYMGPATSAYPFLWEGTRGEFLAAAYSGDFSRDPLAVRYDAAALGTYNQRCVARITKPTDDLLGFLEKEWYAPLAAAPTLNADGEISPRRYLLPDVNTALLTLDNANVAPDAEFSHPDTAVLNKVTVVYPRLIPVDVRDDPTGEFSDGAGMYAREVTVTWEEDENGPSHERFGEQLLEIKSELMCALGKPDGTAAAGEAIREDGHLLAVERGKQAKDRFLYGTTLYPMRTFRSQTGDLVEGDWVEVGVSYLPDYIQGTRGMNRVAQVVGIEDIDPVTRTLMLEDGGDALAPLAQPTVGVAVENAEGGVTLPITAVVAGAEALMEFAISATQPPHDSNLWTPAGRTSVAASMKTPALPSGASVWVGARSYAPGRRPSLRTTPQQVVMTTTPRVTQVRVRVDEDTGIPTVHWTPNAYTLGLRIYYIAQALEYEDEPTLFFDVDASGGSATLPFTAKIGQRITVDAEGYTEWNDPDVGGDAGPKVRAHGGLGHGPVIVDYSLNHSPPGTLEVETETSISTAWVYIWLRNGASPVVGGVPDDRYLVGARRPDDAGIVTLTKAVQDGTWHALIRAYEGDESSAYVEVSDTIVISGVGGGGGAGGVPSTPRVEKSTVDGMGNQDALIQWIPANGTEAQELEIYIDGFLWSTETPAAGVDEFTDTYVVTNRIKARVRAGTGTWSGFSPEILLDGVV
jgi:hypothetical protein